MWPRRMKCQAGVSKGLRGEKQRTRWARGLGAGEVIATVREPVPRFLPPSLPSFLRLG